MGKDRQERKQNHNHIASDRDQSLKYAGAAKMQSPDEARAQQRSK